MITSYDNIYKILSFFFNGVAHALESQESERSKILLLFFFSPIIY